MAGRVAGKETTMTIVRLLSILAALFIFLMFGFKEDK